MFQVLIKRAMEPIGRDTFWKIVCAISERGYEAMGKAMVSSAGLEFNADLLNRYTTPYRGRRPWAYDEEVPSELLFGKNHCVFLIQLIPLEREEQPRSQTERDKEHLSACSFFDSAITSGTAFDVFITDINTAFEQITSTGGEKLTLEWEDISYRSDDFNRMAQGWEHPQLEREQVEASHVLENKNSRELLWNLKRVGSLTLSDIEKSASSRSGQPKQLPLAKKLEKVKLIQREFVVVCKATGNAVVRADSQDKIERFAAEGSRCSCGRLLSEESIEEAITPTELGWKLTDHSYWMTVRTLEVLRELNISLDDVIVNYAEAGDEIDIFLNLCGRDYIIELKDKEFSLNNSYSFNAKFVRYKADGGMIITTETVSPDAKKMLEDTLTSQLRQRRFPALGRPQEEQSIIYVEGIKKIEPNLEALISSARLELAKRYLQRVGSICNLNVAGLVLSRVVPELD